ncbi:hypothetical protein OJ997_27690 [Solirubrobacter phytolaccae]|uniref:Uncharacterized protein n=1 Tax=Solirubrobacter phytolaccae TaxID=1404360 RepID=A0A9X3NCZ3_9ACTN|nr:hypothetical protein [Solirubrobacter phytolaccae]MDA0184123.1 hypothetical protein [Solirubrobacter phytolaccae]
MSEPFDLRERVAQFPTDDPARSAFREQAKRMVDDETLPIVARAQAGQMLAVVVLIDDEGMSVDAALAYFEDLLATDRQFNAIHDLPEYDPDPPADASATNTGRNT